MKKIVCILFLLCYGATFAQKLVVNGVTTPQIASISVTSVLQTNNPRTRTFTYKLPATSTDCNRPLMIAFHGRKI